MRKLVYAVVVMVAAGLVSSMASSPATFAQSGGPSQEEIQAAVQHCIDEQGGTVGLGNMPGVRYSSDGDFECIEPGQSLFESTIGFGGVGGFGGLGAFFVLGLMWALVPMVIAVSVASSRGESPLLAVLLTLLLGWIGLLVVLFGMRRSGEEFRRSFGEGDARTASSLSDRLRALEQLRHDGAITQREYDQRRSEILAEI